MQPSQRPVAVVVHSMERSQQPALLRPQEVRTVEVPWYEDQVGACVVFSVISKNFAVFCAPQKTARNYLSRASIHKEL